MSSNNDLSGHSTTTTTTGGSSRGGHRADTEASSSVDPGASTSTTPSGADSRAPWPAAADDRSTAGSGALGLPSSSSSSTWPLHPSHPKVDSQLDLIREDEQHTMYPAGSSSHHHRHHHHHHHPSTQDGHSHGHAPSHASHRHPLSRQESSASDFDGPKFEYGPTTSTSIAGFTHAPWTHLSKPLPDTLGRAHVIPRSNKGKGRAIDGVGGVDDKDSLENASLRPSVSASLPPDTSDDETDESDENDDDDDEEDDDEEGAFEVVKTERHRDRGRTSTKLPKGLVQIRRDPMIRIRRVGALGISVSSNDSDGDENMEEAVMSEEKGISDDREEAGITAGTSSLDSAGELEARKAKGTRRISQALGASNEEFRTIVDDLALENQALKAKLRRYEAARVPATLKRDRLFEIRYFEGLSEEKREDLETFLTRYVQGISQLHDTSTPSPAVASAATTSTTAEHRPQVLLHSSHSIASTVLPSLPPPKIPDRKFHRSRKSASSERDVLAGPSDFGFEPTSTTGTGAGIKIDSSSDSDRKKRKQKKHKKARKHTHADDIEGPSKAVDAATTSGDTGETTPTKEDEPTAIWATRENTQRPSVTIDDKSMSTAQAIVNSIEKLFRNSFEARCKGMKGTRSNEEYLSELLEQDFLSNGWVYLKLVCTMAMTHRFSVTMPFIESAIRTLSTRLEVSSSGAKVRWKGPDLFKPQTGGSIKEDRATPMVVTGPFTNAMVPSYADRQRALDQRRLSWHAPSSTGLDSSNSDMTGDRERSWNSGSGPVASTAATSLYPDSVVCKLEGANASTVAPSQITRHTPTTAAVQRLGLSPGSQIHPLGSESKVQSVRAAAASSVGRRTQNSPGSHATKSSTSPPIKVSTHTPYLPFFSRCDHVLVRSSRAASSRGAASTAGGNSSAQASGSEPKRVVAADEDEAVDDEIGITGTMLFYADAKFCSDLSKEPLSEVCPSDRNAPRPLGHRPREEGSVERSPSPDGATILGKAVRVVLPIEDDEAMDVDGKGLLHFDDGVAMQPSKNTSANEPLSFGQLQGLKTSGMSDVSPADAFTIVVTLRFDDLPEPTIEKRTRPDAAITGEPSTKRPRFKRHQIVDTRMIPHPPTSSVRPRLRKGLSHVSSSSSNGGATSDETDADLPLRGIPLLLRQPSQADGASLIDSTFVSYIRETLWRRSHSQVLTSHSPPQSGPTSHVHMPSPDYLASLNLPVYTWSPHAPSSRFHWSQSSRGPSTGMNHRPRSHRSTTNAPLLRLGDSVLPIQGTDGGDMMTTSSEEDVRAIDLDESV
ncbi:BZ3500_MvSof-1268-A1-R1_Chr9g10442 [Microbotryum saponariae]|uniref:BZ3500_MvSof-1268-A1-R1_Chr9g10442 protein n=1 Tax=Microbotryum saponariae TaxID=289078 RepID=A0A2X0KFL0_9BASI|nr:BZ3501_MvSof-1269-A2-R1_Chr9g10192 [Microbotryum saponariae]SDA00098.1 BZ3500_MvSof-1268-A1-R1_Chr9g10442 [Microbotryum saponariae]